MKFRLIGVFLCLLMTYPAYAQSIKIEDAWVRATMPNITTSAAYMIITNNSEQDDRLLSASTDVAEETKIHINHTLHSNHGPGKTRTMPNGLDIPAGQSVVIRPRSYHIMLVGVKGNLRPGDQVKLNLTFEKAGTIPFTIGVREMDGSEP